FCANATASGRGSIVVRSTIAPSALDTTFWVTTTTSSWRSGRIPSVCASAATMRAARSSPGEISGMPSSAMTSRRDGSRSATERADCRLGGEQVGGRVEVEGQGSVQLQPARPGRGGPRRVRRAAGLPERRVDLAWRADEERVRSTPVPVRDDRDEPAPVVGGTPARQQLVDRRRRDGWQVGRQDEDRRRAARHCDGSRRLDRLVQPGRPLDQADRVELLGDAGGVGVHRDHDRPLDASRIPGCDEGAAKQVCDQLDALLRVEVLAEPCLRGLEPPDRDERPRPREVGARGGLHAAHRSRGARRVPQAARAACSTSAASLARPASPAMIVSVTTVLSPSSLICGSSAASSASSTYTSATPVYCRATPSALASFPSETSIRSAGPFSATPPTMPDTATTGAPRERAVCNPASMPATDRIGRTDTNGLDGAMTIASAASRAASTSGVERASSTPTNRRSRTSGVWWSRTK